MTTHWKFSPQDWTRTRWTQVTNLRGVSWPAMTLLQLLIRWTKENTWFLLKQKNWFSWHHLNTWVDFTRAKSSFFCCQFQLLHAFPAQLFLTCQLQRLMILLVSQLSNPVKPYPTTPQIFDFPRNHFSTQKCFYLLQFQIKSASYNV